MRRLRKDFDFYVLDDNGERIYPIMGCYGIGTTRLLGVIVEKFNDDQGVIWPESVAPFKVHLIDVDQREKAQEIYNLLTENKVEVLYDDRLNISAGEKFIDADLIGIPSRIVVSKQSLKKGGVEIKKRNEEEKRIIPVAKIQDFI